MRPCRPHAGPLPGLRDDGVYRDSVERRITDLLAAHPALLARLADLVVSR